jgi:hypothetical protein
MVYPCFIVHLFCKAPGSPSGLTQSFIQWVLGDLALVVEHPGHDTDHSPLLMLRIRMSAAVKAVPLLHAPGQLQRYTFIKKSFMS